MNRQITYEPVNDYFPAQITAEDLHNLIERIRPFLERSEEIRVIEYDKE